VRILKKILKYVAIILGIIFIILYIAFYKFSTPKKDATIQEEFAEKNYIANIQYLDFDHRKVRVLSTKEKIDPKLLTIVFVHGAIGSSLDFKEYMTDNDINNSANLISYDRLGYGPSQNGEVLNSIAKETQLLQTIIKQFNIDKLILVGYSFGGPIALNYARNNPVEKLILCAPALYGNHEKTPWVINFYKWKLTRFLVPDVWKSASKEKLSHAKDLSQFENVWEETKTTILGVHGNNDAIVPYENSTTLQRKFSNDQFNLVTIEGAGHGLIWSNFDIIKNEILKLL